MFEVFGAVLLGIGAVIAVALSTACSVDDRKKHPVQYGTNEAAIALLSGAMHSEKHYADLFNGYEAGSSNGHISPPANNGSQTKAELDVLNTIMSPGGFSEDSKQKMLAGGARDSGERKKEGPKLYVDRGLDIAIIRGEIDPPKKKSLY